jgi:hypothetical protein
MHISRVQGLSNLDKRLCRALTLYLPGTIHHWKSHHVHRAGCDIVLTHHVCVPARSSCQHAHVALTTAPPDPAGQPVAVLAAVAVVAAVAMAAQTPQHLLRRAQQALQQQLPSGRTAAMAAASCGSWGHAGCCYWTTGKMTASLTSTPFLQQYSARPRHTGSASVLPITATSRMEDWACRCVALRLLRWTSMLWS